MVLRIVNGKNHRDILKGFIPVTMGSHKGHQASVMIMDMENVRFFLKVPDPLQRGDLKTEKTFLFIPVRVPGEWIQIDAGAVKPGGYIDQDKVEAQRSEEHTSELQSRGQLV